MRILLLQNGAMWNMGPVHDGICATGLLCCHISNSVAVTRGIFSNQDKQSTSFQEAKAKFTTTPKPIV